MLSSLLSYTLLVRGTFAVFSDYFPPPAEGLTVLKSSSGDGSTLSYKKTDVCESSYSGYVHLPISVTSDIGNYPTNMFYWFFPAREAPETAPISIWIGGGPGESAIAGALMENGPCYANQDGNSTRTNPFSRNNRVNMLYVDQPLGAGYSYSSLVNVTFNQLSGLATATNFSSGLTFAPNSTFIPGTIASPDLALTANNSNIAAKAMWHFAQTWFDTFPIYHPQEKSISLWTNSYGGYFGPAIFKYWESQNKKIKSRGLKAKYLHLDTLGIENGCIDALSQALSWPEYAYNNTYGLQIINETVYNAIVKNATDPKDGCIAAIQNCRKIANVGDPDFYANNKTVNDICGLATQQCFPLLDITQNYANRHFFDISQIGVQSFPGFQHVAFFNQRWVQQSLGVPLNYTDNINLNPLYFNKDADAFRQTQGSLEYLLANDIQVALVYGDRDSRCNWIGVENVSLTINYPDAPNFRAAGYADLKTNDSYVGGVVRQYNGLSFSRVFEAGHQVSSFQPETVNEIFNRVMFRHDVATGKLPANTKNRTGEASHYQSKGPSSSWDIKNILPASPPSVCNIWLIPATCTANQIAALGNGTAVTKDFIVISPAPQM